MGAPKHLAGRPAALRFGRFWPIRKLVCRPHAFWEPPRHLAGRPAAFGSPQGTLQADQPPSGAPEAPCRQTSRLQVWPGPEGSWSADQPPSRPKTAKSEGSWSAGLQTSCLEVWPFLAQKAAGLQTSRLLGQKEPNLKAADQLPSGLAVLGPEGSWSADQPPSGPKTARPKGSWSAGLQTSSLQVWPFLAQKAAGLQTRLLLAPPPAKNGFLSERLQRLVPEGGWSADQLAPGPKKIKAPCFCGRFLVLEHRSKELCFFWTQEEAGLQTSRLLGQGTASALEGTRFWSWKACGLQTSFLMDQKPQNWKEAGPPTSTKWPPRRRVVCRPASLWTKNPKTGRKLGPTSTKWPPRRRVVCRPASLWTKNPKTGRKLAYLHGAMGLPEGVWSADHVPSGAWFEPHGSICFLRAAGIVLRGSRSFLR